MWYVEGGGGIWLLKNVCAILAHTPQLSQTKNALSFSYTKACRPMKYAP